MYQLVVRKRITSSAYVGGSHEPGALIWAQDADAAHHLIGNKVCAWPESEKPARVPGMPMRRGEGWPVDRFAAIEREWEGRTAVCIASGPSTTEQDLETIRQARERDEVRVCAVNDMYLAAPWADLMYFADARWWHWHNGTSPDCPGGLAKKFPWQSFSAEEVRQALAGFKGQKVTIYNTGMNVSDPDVFMVQCADGRSAFSANPRELALGGNSGYQVLNLAALAGARRVLLVGYDMRFAGGRSHAHNGHPNENSPHSYNNFAGRFTAMAGPMKEFGCEVLNCTPGSAVRAFRRVTLEEGLRART